MKIQKTSLNLAEQRVMAKYNIELWLIENVENEKFDLYQNNLLALSLDKTNFSFTMEFNKLIFAYWTEEKAESWQVINYKIIVDRLYFDLLIPFKKEVINCFLQIRKTDSPIANFENKRYLVQLRNLINQHFTGYKIKKAIVNNTYSSYYGAIAKLLIESNTMLFAAIAVSSYEPIDKSTCLLGQGLKWLSFLQNRFAPIQIKKLMLFAPTKAIETLAERLTLITSAEHKIELFEVNETENSLIAVKPFDQGDLGLSLAKKFIIAKKEKKLPPSITKQIEWVKSLAPNLIETKINASRSKIIFSINGLEFAAISLKTEVIEFGYQEKKVLSLENTLEFTTLVTEISYYRQAHSPNKQHLYYRSKAEAWLEKVISQNISILDPNIISRYVYRQVPIIKQTHKFIDLLAVSRDGQLVIIELKAVEDFEVPFQALDYWLRVEWYRLRGDFERNYFPKIKLKNAPALLYLVMPRLRCHKDLLTIASFIDQKVPLHRIAINDNWRQSLKVESRDLLTDSRHKTFHT